ncbi:adenylate kinase [Fragilaria crotonensis]|nr:adenylate kinase [Fragilaria crotonensis]
MRAPNRVASASWQTAFYGRRPPNITGPVLDIAKRAAPKRTISRAPHSAHIGQPPRLLRHCRLCHRPKRFRELVHLGDPNAYGACDACRRFMGGGLWFLPGRPSLVWQAAFQPVIQRNVVTGDNKKAGAISISGDLELSATLAHTYALTQVTDTTERPVCWLAGDNRASLAWASEGSFTASTTRAYLLLRHSSLHQHFFCYVPQFDDITGPANVMANDASRRWDLLDTELLSHTSTLCTPSRSQLGLL